MKNKSIIITLSVVMGITLLSVFAALIVFIITTNTYSNQLENLYKRNYYELSSNINDIEVDMSKLIATNSTTTKREVLTNLYSNCTMANNNLSMLPISNTKIKNVNEFVNKLGGYVYSLLTKVNNNQSFSDYDYQTINDLHSESQRLMVAYNEHISSLKFDYKILKDVNFSDGDKSSFDAGLVNSDNSKVPTLIYDGPFADSVVNKEIKGLPNNEITKEQASDIVMTQLTMLDVTSIRYVGESNGNFYTYNFSVEADNRTLFVQVSKMGGKIVDITGYSNGNTIKYDLNQCIDMAETLARSLGYDNVYQVWYAENNNIVYINLAPIINHVIYYPDLVKVKVDKCAGVIALEGKNYWYNHIERDLDNINVTFDKAQNNLSKALTVNERNYALIPNKYSGETLTYEFVCTWKDYTYYVYIDVSTGEEVNIMRVIKTTSGDLII